MTDEALPAGPLGEAGPHAERLPVRGGPEGAHAYRELLPVADESERELAALPFDVHEGIRRADAGLRRGPVWNERDDRALARARRDEIEAEVAVASTRQPPATTP